MTSLFQSLKRGLCTAAGALSHSPFKLGIVGTGRMGVNLAALAAAVGKMPVKMLSTPHSYALDIAQKRLNVAVGRMSDNYREAVKEHVEITCLPEDLSQCNFIIEAVPDNEKVKTVVLQRLDEIASAEAVFATTGSSISITKLAAATKRPLRVIGMYFFRKVEPIEEEVSLLPVVEVIPSVTTSEETLQEAKKFCRLLNREVVLSKDTPGFVSGRLLSSYVNEAAYLVYEGVGTPEHVDRAMRIGCEMTHGPLRLGDSMGLDHALKLLRAQQQGLGGERYRPCPLLVQYVQAGWLGVKSGRGFFHYYCTREDQS